MPSNKLFSCEDKIKTFMYTKSLEVLECKIFALYIWELVDVNNCLVKLLEEKQIMNLKGGLSYKKAIVIV